MGVVENEMTVDLFGNPINYDDDGDNDNFEWLDDDHDFADDGDFDVEAEWDACKDDDDIAMDGDFVGHPFRGNQYKKSSHASSAAVHASKSAKRAEKSGNKVELKKAHATAAYAHKSASIGATGKAKKYHNKMARFHAKHGGIAA